MQENTKSETPEDFSENEEPLSNEEETSPQSPRSSKTLPPNVVLDFILGMHSIISASAENNSVW